MAIKDLGKGIKNSLNGAVDTVKAKAKEVELPDIKDVSEKAAEQIKGLFKKPNENKQPAEDAAPVQSVTGVSVRTAIKITYFLMAADGEIYHGEEEKFDAIGKELAPDFPDFREQIIQECRAALDKAIDPEDYYDALQDGAEEALRAAPDPEEPMISSKHLVWNLLSVAYSDEQYNDVERRFLKYVVRKLNVDKAIFLEMESSMLTIMDIEREIAWIKTVNRPYLTIEAIVNELLTRKNAVFDSIVALVTL